MNARDNLKPKTIRLAILAGLANGAITTIDDLQIKINEPRKKVAQNVYPAAIDGLIRRVRDDITGGPAYQITDAGRKYLEKYADGSDDDPGQDSTVKESLTVGTEPKKSEAGEKVVTRKDDDIFGMSVKIRELMEKNDKLQHELADAKSEVERLQNAVGAVIEYDDSVPHNAGWFVYGESSAHETAELAMIAYAKSNEKRIKELKASLDLARMARTVANAGYVVQRPVKPLTRFSKIENAKARAISFARSGVRSQVFALVHVGMAIPGAEWRE